MNIAIDLDIPRRACVKRRSDTHPDSRRQRTVGSWCQAGIIAPKRYESAKLHLIRRPVHSQYDLVGELCGRGIGWQLSLAKNKTVAVV